MPELQFGEFLKRIQNAPEGNVNEIVDSIIKEIGDLSEKEAGSQSQLLTLREAAVKRGIDGKIFQPLLENTKFDNVKLL